MTTDIITSNLLSTLLSF